MKSSIRQSGFTFVEVMFATVILGIGLIMVAALLPVGMRQTVDTADKVTGRAVAENGFFTMQAVANEDFGTISGGTFVGESYPVGLPLTTPTGTPIEDVSENLRVATMIVNGQNLDRFANPLSVGAGGGVNGPAALVSTDQDISLSTAGNNRPAGPTNIIARTFGDRILTTDRRYAWVALYRRGVVLSGVGNLFALSKTADITVIALKNRTGDEFEPADLWNFRNGPHLLHSQILRGRVDGTTGVIIPDRIRLFASRVEGNSNAPNVDYPNDNNIGGEDWSELKVEAAAPGAFIVVAVDLIEDPSKTIGDIEGLLLKLGRQLDTGTTYGDDYVEFEIDPSTPLPTNIPDDLPGATTNDAADRPLVWLIGRQWNDDEGRFDGQPMPIGFFQGRMPLR